MSYVLMRVMQFHGIAHSHALTQNDYSFRLSSYGFGCYGKGTMLGGVFEIGFVDKNPLVFQVLNHDISFIARENDVFIIPPNHHVEVKSQFPGEHKHTSAEFLLDCTTNYLDKESLSSADYEAIEDNSLFLPYVIKASKSNEDLIAMIRCIARDRMLMHKRSYFEDCVNFMQILSSIRLNALKDKDELEVSPAHHRYCGKAKEYISQNIGSRITLDEIAKSVGINKNYLTNVFSTCENVPISEYINRMKLKYMLELITKYKYSIKKAGESVGFQDANYVSRLFRKYHGITVTEYLSMHQ